MQHLEHELSVLQESHQYRSLKESNRLTESNVLRNNKVMTSFISNDYLGIASNASLKSEFLKELDKQQSLSFGSASSRLLEGNHQVFNELEQKVASSFQKGGCLFMNSGWHANTGILSCIPQKGDLIISDKLNHASIVDGIRLSNAQFERFRHKDYDHLEDLLKKKRKDYNHVYIISESLFSMDGDYADLQQLVDLKNKYNAYFILDEAHSIGLFQNGLGYAASLDLADQIDIHIMPCGKALGGVGALVVSSQVVKEYLINKCRAFIFTTALPSINAAWMSFVWDRLPSFENERQKLEENIQYYNVLRQKDGFDIVSRSCIQPILIGENQKTIKISDNLLEKDMVCSPIRYPTVPKNASRLRLSITSMHSFDQIQTLCKEVSSQLKQESHAIQMA
ncbi:aminotransferase class I/II-fold pyridoxal phosphate-dependent enzyme [Flammeovirga yaeyamensis]|uniref:Aminotransferase class I/II-fold pyridoxal phosphate-dependent enzyme n=1 Tax=Flammeovirga yaeyamensis TaxID=367791 RepID=A0AAX1MZK2_9BACT|nr:8-amino-7-oxononanoate synthase [Flammeovirga yaeyamensis]MBB3700922.1 8-amino-7-oxononanoate synthase [Flammeovirga yaeyamensis]NMF38029.1 8-amino-7-oxononanoate synthase [Flammeovirga yaeyamensis]QWG00679.1 aminotransferase class I/II-fold pyridoxal phosphate-dependent enzyme [Flammeovirga yaeyamensis]